jgi:hypothetical protein
MIKDVFKLRKDSWHMRLMNWMWGYHYYDFPNMYPYFWLSLANLVLAPFKALTVLVIFPILHKLGDIVDHWSDMYDKKCLEKEQKWLEEVRAKIKANPNDPIIDKIVNSLYKGSKSSLYSAPKVYRNLYHRHDELGNLIHDKLHKLYNLKREEKWKAQEEAKQPVSKPKTTRSIISKDTILVKTIAKAIGGVIGLFSLYGLYLLGMWILTWNWSKIGEVSFEILILTVLAAIVLGILVGLVLSVKIFITWFWCKYGEACIPCSERREKLGNFFITIGKGVAYPFIWLFRGLSLLWEVLMALKQNNCPAIDWEE